MKLFTYPLLLISTTVSIQPERHRFSIFANCYTRGFFKAYSNALDKYPLIWSVHVTKFAFILISINICKVYLKVAISANRREENQNVLKSSTNTCIGCNDWQFWCLTTEFSTKWRKVVRGLRYTSRKSRAEYWTSPLSFFPGNTLTISNHFALFHRSALGWRLTCDNFDICYGVWDLNGRKFN